MTESNRVLVYSNSQTCFPLNCTSSDDGDPQNSDWGVSARHGQKQFKEALTNLGI